MITKGAVRQRVLGIARQVLLANVGASRRRTARRWVQKRPVRTRVQRARLDLPACRAPGSPQSLAGRALVVLRFRRTVLVVRRRAVRGGSGRFTLSLIHISEPTRPY